MTEPASTTSAIASFDRATGETSVPTPEPVRSGDGRVVAPGGWRRAVTGVLVGLGAGVVHRLAVAADEVVRDRGRGAR